jgi:hypothetical protein
MSDDARFIDSDLWKKLVVNDDSVPSHARQEAAKGLRGDDLHDLVQRLDSDSFREQYAAMGMLMLSLRGRLSFPDGLLDELRDKATEMANYWTLNEPRFGMDAIRRLGLALFEADHPPDVPARAYYLLAAIDRERAAQFLVSHFSFESLTAHGKREVIHHLAELCSWDKSKCSETARKQLSAIAEAGGPEAKSAAGYLIGRQIMRRSEVEKITEKGRAAPPGGLDPAAVPKFIALHPQFAGREAELMKHATAWRKTKSIAALNGLHSGFLLSLPEGSPIDPLLAILGPPDWWSDPYPSVLSFSSDEGPALLVHVTTDGKLSGLKLK